MLLHSARSWGKLPIFAVPNVRWWAPINASNPKMRIFVQGQGNQAIAKIDAEIGQKVHLWMDDAMFLF